MSRILRPVPELPDIWELVILVGLLLGIPVGTGITVANLVAKLPGVAWGVAAMCAGFALLAFYAVFDLEGREAPLVIDADKDRNCRRLKIRNPNHFTLRNCYVSLKEARVLRCTGQATPPGEGFRFAWGSWQKQGSGLVADIPPASERFVDIVGLNEHDQDDDQFYHHSTSGNQMLPIRQVFPMPPGEYEYTLEVGGDDTPAHSIARVRIVLDKGRLLSLILQR
jgi:hypothetical protein